MKITRRKLTLIGLAFGALGVVLIFFFGFPQPLFESVIGPEEGDPHAAALKRTYTVRSLLGLASLLIGIGFEGWAEFVDDRKPAVSR